MADKDVYYRLALEIKQAEYNKSLQALANLAKEVSVLDAGFDASADSADKFTKEVLGLNRAENQLKQLAKLAGVELNLGSSDALRRADALVDRIEDVKSEAGKAADNVKELADNLSEAERRASRLDL